MSVFPTKFSSNHKMPSRINKRVYFGKIYGYYVHFMNPYINMGFQLLWSVPNKASTVPVIHVSHDPSKFSTVQNCAVCGNVLDHDFVTFQRMDTGEKLLLETCTGKCKLVVYDAFSTNAALEGKGFVVPVVHSVIDDIVFAETEDEATDGE